MVLEFLNTFGPLFDIKEIIRGGITFGSLDVNNEGLYSIAVVLFPEDIEYAITTQEMYSLLFEIIKFLLQVRSLLMVTWSSMSVTVEQEIFSG